MTCILDLPLEIMDEIFLFLNITHYLCNVMLVCKQWNIDNINDMLTNKSHFVQQLIHNSCHRKLTSVNEIKIDGYLMSVYDLIHEYELSAAYTSYHAYQIAYKYIKSYHKHKNKNHISYIKFSVTLPLYSLFEYIKLKTLPRYPLYFDLDRTM
eukprot:UN13480